MACSQPTGSTRLRPLPGRTALAGCRDLQETGRNRVGPIRTTLLVLLAALAHLTAAPEPTRAADQLSQSDLKAYRAHGYIPSTEEAESVSRTLEYAYDDWCIAQFARAIGDGQRSDVSPIVVRREEGIAFCVVC